MVGPCVFMRLRNCAGAGLGFEQVIEPHVVNQLDGVGEVGMESDGRHVRDDEERRVFEGDGVVEELGAGLMEVAFLAFVFPAETDAFPHVGRAFAAKGFRDGHFKAIERAGGIGLDVGGFVEEAAEIDDVLLGGGTFVEGGGSPFGDEFLGGHSPGLE